MHSTMFWLFIASAVLGGCGTQENSDRLDRLERTVSEQEQEIEALKAGLRTARANANDEFIVSLGNTGQSKQSTKMMPAYTYDKLDRDDTARRIGNLEMDAIRARIAETDRQSLAAASRLEALMVDSNTSKQQDRQREAQARDQESRDRAIRDLQNRALNEDVERRFDIFKEQQH